MKDYVKPFLITVAAIWAAGYCMYKYRGAIPLLDDAHKGYDS